MIMEPKNHPIEKPENHLNQTSMLGFHVSWGIDSAIDGNSTKDHVDWMILSIFSFA